VHSISWFTLMMFLVLVSMTNGLTIVKKHARLIEPVA
jgi:hypothetical protein